MQDDPSQRAPEPLRRVDPAVLVRTLASAEKVKELSQGEAENRQHAAAEIAIIFELNDSRAFKWFVAEFIDKPYREALLKLKDPRQRLPGESLEAIQMTYFALREVKSGMLQREIAHRTSIDPADEEIPRLRERLDLL